MATAAQIPIAQRRDSLRLMLEQRGLAHAEAVEHVARMSDVDVTNDLAFHLREDEASKRLPPAPLPFGELVAHYTGPMHRLGDRAAEEAARGLPRSPATAPPGSAAPNEDEGGIDPRYVAGAAVGSIALAVVIFFAARAALRARPPAPELDAPPPRSVTPASRGRRGR